MLQPGSPTAMSLYTNSSHPGKILHPRGYLTMSEDIFEVISLLGVLGGGATKMDMT